MSLLIHYTKWRKKVLQFREVIIELDYPERNYYKISNLLGSNICTGVVLTRRLRVWDRLMVSSVFREYKKRETCVDYG